MNGKNEEKLVFVGIIACSATSRTLSTYSGYLAVVDGKIAKKGLLDEFEKLKAEGYFAGYKITYLDHDQYIQPGFVDCHTHAPQFPNLGIGLDRPLLEWLKTYTFPLEKKYVDVAFARKVYDQVVRRLITNGTTTACYFGSLHLESTKELARCVTRLGQRALVGKVSMNVSNEEGYFNDTCQELEETETFLAYVNDMGNDLVEPVVTPRFAISCDCELMRQLGKLAQKYNCRIQSHLSENKAEVEEVLKCNPACKSYSDVYDRCKLLHSKTIMAHAIHLTPEEIVLVRDRQVGVAHCPASNTRLKSGMCPVRQYINAGIKVGLGTDLAGGDSSTIMDALRRTMDVSTHIEIIRGETMALSWKEAFYLATMGGARVLNLDHKIGNFDIGKDFDALLVDVYVTGGQLDYYECALEKTSDEYAASLVQRFAYVGDDRNILQVYVKGKKVKDIMQN